MCSLQEEAFELAYKLACEQLARIDDIEEQCRNHGARLDFNRIIIEYLNRSYLITLRDTEISLIGSAEQVPLKDKILILHYLTSTKSTPAGNKLITFKQLPGVASYFPVFFQRAIKPLLNRFGKEPQLLVASAAKLGGHRADYGDVSVTINAFSRVPITFVLWRGDEEFAPNGSIMFESTICDYLSSEDITILCETIAWKLVNFRR